VVAPQYFSLLGCPPSKMNTRLCSAFAYCTMLKIKSTREVTVLFKQYIGLHETKPFYFISIRGRTKYVSFVDLLDLL
jgi:hypothetical protein